MERVDGTVYDVDALAGESDENVAQMCRGMAEQLAAIHAVDLDATGLRALDDGATHLVRELDHWAGQVGLVECGPLPALERLLAALWDSMPAGCPKPTLVHGDARPGNFAFVDGVVGAVFAWEMATVGDPLTDIGWLELAWRRPGGFAGHPGTLPIDELIAHYEAVSGRPPQNRPWYRAFNAYKLAVSVLTGAVAPVAGVPLAEGVSALTAIGLADLGIVEYS
jgi:aminoglycoside phosphotransferase (APT) family kinase protein